MGLCMYVSGLGRVSAVRVIRWTAVLRVDANSIVEGLMHSRDCNK
jgi:hypothetical protein